MNHLPLLAEFVLKTHGAILSIGTDPIVTPVLALLAKDRILVTVAESREERVAYASLYGSDSHVVIHSPPEEPMGQFDVALIAAASQEARIKWVDALCQTCRFLIVPDCGPKGENYQVDYFNHRRVWAWLGPPYTVVLSKTERVDGKS